MNVKCSERCEKDRDLPFCTNISLFSNNISFTFSYRNHSRYHHVAVNSLNRHTNFPKTYLHHVFITTPRSARGKQLLKRTTHIRYESQKLLTPPVTRTPFSSTHLLTQSNIRSTTRSETLRSMQEARRRSREQASQSLHDLQIRSLLLERVHKSTLQSSQEGVCKAGSRILKDCCIQACGEEFGAQGGT